MAKSFVIGVWILFAFELYWSVVRGLECGYPGAPSFGRPHPVKESYRPGDAVSFTCAHGHSLQGPLQRVCLFNGTWAGQLPLCGIYFHVNDPLDNDV
ncbi:uncharacterized protein TNIN_465961 [Trichonephila inaurata madagascariensis]|uniref:Sushi domain-containing protein n=1 Tax=Trichonephila inaurata madagascariensis TaxID=2747483 RepID=A0A8X7BRI6_9ARAC|nr:uncharacterized protein TNIN_465961 [Trichonephila inaurata madagascariensis]